MQPSWLLQLLKAAPFFRVKLDVQATLIDYLQENEKREKNWKRDPIVKNVFPSLKFRSDISPDRNRLSEVLISLKFDPSNSSFAALFSLITR